jgi:hypothetical protein
MPGHIPPGIPALIPIPPGLLAAPAVSHLVPQDHVQKATHNGRYKCAKESAPEPWLCQGETDVELIANPTGEGKEQGIDHQGEKTQSNDDEQAGYGFERRTQNGIH